MTGVPCLCHLPRQYQAPITIKGEMVTLKQTVLNKRLWCWFAFSLVAHIALLFALGIPGEKMTHSKWGSTELSVIVQQQGTRKQKKQKQPKILQAKSHVTIASAAHNNSKRQSSKPVAQHHPGTRHNYLLGQLRTSLSRHLVYPALARKQGWQGIVTVRLQVEADGLLKKIRIRQSSGYNVLDDSAINSLRKIRRLGAKERYLDRPHRLTLRVVYQLTDKGYGTSTF